MASNPLVPAVDHFSLPQLMADVNLCRNVLNDVGAPPAEIFVLVAALEARIPQMLLEHSATNDLSVVEPRLIAELNERGVERSRAEWAVAAWREVVAGSTLGQQTVRPSSPAQSSGDATVRPSTPTAAGPAMDAPTGPVVNVPSRPLLDGPLEAATVRPSTPVVAPASAPRPPTLRSIPPRGAHSKKGIVIAAIVAVLVVAAVVAWLAWPSGKHHTSTAASSGASKSAASAPGETTPVSSPASGSAAASSGSATSLNAPLGAAKTFPVAASAAWTYADIKVTKGQRINITATGQISFGPGPCSPDGSSDQAYDMYSLIGGGHAGALIGLIAGSGTPFLVGANYNDVAPATGYLYLGINDVGVSDNSGQFSATVRIQQ